jgi:hypothetical protein
VASIIHKFKHSTFSSKKLNSINEWLFNYSEASKREVLAAIRIYDGTILQEQPKEISYVIGHIDSNNSIMKIKSNILTKQKAIKAINSSAATNVKLFKLVEVKVISHIEEC